MWKTLFRRFFALHRLPLQWARKKLNASAFLFLSAILTGISAGLAAYALKSLVHYVNVFFIQENPIPFGRYMLPFFPMIGLLLCVFVVRYFYKNEAGKGIARVLQAIARQNSVIPPNRMHSQVVTAGITVGLGGSSGLEGPIVVTGAAIGSNYARSYRLGYRERTLLLAAGVAGGIAAVFNAPVAGLMFAIEIILAGVVLTEFMPLIVAAVSGALCGQLLLHQGVLFHFDHLPSFYIKDLPWFIFLGFLAANLSIYYGKATHQVELFFYRLRHWPYARAVMGGLVLALLIALFPALFGEGFSFLQALIDGHPERLLQGSLIPWPSTSSFWLILVIGCTVLFKSIATATTIHAGGNGGNFAPSLFMGGMLGWTFAQVINLLFDSEVSSTQFMLVGMAGMLSGVMYAPLTAIFLIAEISGSYTLILPLMVVAAVSYFTTRYLRPISPETALLVEKGEIYTGHKDENVLQNIALSKIIEKDILSLRAEQTLGDLVEAIRASPRQIFAITTEKGDFLGLISLEQVKTILFDREQYEVIRLESLVKPPVGILPVDASMKTVIHIFEETGAWNLPVVQGSQFIGLISRSSVFSAYRNELIRQS